MPISVPESQVKGVMQEALHDLYLNDGVLMQDKAHERAITHKLAEHLQKRLPGWTVDCEYNRWWRSSQEPHSKVLRTVCSCQRGEGEQPERPIFPDILVHHRRSDDNLLVVEAKTTWSESNDGHDVCKVRAFTESPRYAYQVGLVLVLGETSVHSNRVFPGDRRWDLETRT